MTSSVVVTDFEAESITRLSSDQCARLDSLDQHTSQVLEEQVKPRAEQAWREAQPKIKNAKLGLKRFAQRVREEYRQGRDGE